MQSVASLTQLLTRNAAVLQSLSAVQWYCYDSSLHRCSLRLTLHDNLALLDGTLISFVLEQLWHVVACPSHSAASLFDFVNERVSVYKYSLANSDLISYKCFFSLQDETISTIQ